MGGETALRAAESVDQRERGRGTGERGGRYAQPFPPPAGVLAEAAWVMERGPAPSPTAEWSPHSGQWRSRLLGRRRSGAAALPPCRSSLLPLPAPASRLSSRRAAGRGRPVRAAGWGARRRRRSFFPLALGGRIQQRAHFVRREHAELSRLQRTQGDRTDGGPDQTPGGVADR